MEEKTGKNFLRKIPQKQLEKLIDGFIEIELVEAFQIIRETLSRIGVLKNGTLYQSVHILHKKGKYYLVHFKQLFELDGRDTTFDNEDMERLYKTAHLLHKWGLIDFIKPEVKEDAEKCKSVFVHIAKVEDIREGKVLLKKKYNL